MTPDSQSTFFLVQKKKRNKGRVFSVLFVLFLSIKLYKKMFFKSVQRVSSKATRMTKRFTSYQTGSEGATASTGAFGTKEKAIENQWARSHVS
jgi:hypothetical protein